MGRVEGGQMDTALPRSWSGAVLAMSQKHRTQAEVGAGCWGDAPAGLSSTGTLHFLKLAGGSLSGVLGPQAHISSLRVAPRGAGWGGNQLLIALLSFSL